MSSILTNNGAMVALQTMRSTNQNMAKTQSEISTGMSVATAKDNASSWAIASTMRTDVAMFDTLSKSLTANSALVGVARDASERIVDTLRDMQERMVMLENPDSDAPKINAELASMRENITSIANNAQFNGINMIGTGGAAQNVTVAIRRDGGGALTPEVLNIAATDLSGLATTSLAEIETALQTAITAASTFGTAQNRIDAQNDFLKSQSDALKVGIGALVDADMEEASARLQALQVQQQLGIQALSIANQQPQNILSLFR